MIHLITGANRGIGLELTRQLLARGDTVVATARKPQGSELESLEAPEGRLHVVQLDVSDDESVRRAAEETARLVDHVDVLINNAGIYGSKSHDLPIDLDEVRQVHEVNVLGPIRVVNAFRKLTDASKVRKLIFVTSKMGSIEDNGSGGAYAYRMSKAALNMLAKNLAVDLADEGYLTLAIHPGWVATRMGGPNAIHGLEDSAKNIIGYLDELDSSRSGELWGAMERRIPW